MAALPQSNPTSPWLDFRLFWHIFLWPCCLPTADQKLFHIKFGLASYHVYKDVFQKDFYPTECSWLVSAKGVLGMEWTMWGQTVKKWPLPVLALSGQHIFGLASKGNERQSVKNLELTAELFRESDFSRAALKLAQRLISLLKLQRSIRVTLK